MTTTKLLIERRDAELERLKIPTLRLEFADVVRDPAAAVDQLIAFGELAPTAEQRAAAIAHVEKRL